MGSDAADTRPIALHISPHPDDELIGPPAAIQLLQQHGYRVRNLICGLGRPDQWERRRHELYAAASAFGVEPVEVHPPVLLSRSDDLSAARIRLHEAIEQELWSCSPAIVIGPQIDDGHHGHEVVGAAIRDVLERAAAPVVWWMWGIWRDATMPNILVPFPPAALEKTCDVLEKYAGEVERNDYRQLVQARAVTAAITGVERVLGFGSTSIDGLDAGELITEVTFEEGRWLLGRPRVLDGNTILCAPTSTDVSTWLRSPSPHETVFGRWTS